MADLLTLDDVRAVGVEPALAPKYYVSRQQGKPTRVPAGPSIADGVKESLPCANAYTLIERLVDELAVVFGLPTGMGIQDNTTAHRIYRNALKNGAGTLFEFFE
ncbi:MAG: hypothetical protein ABSH53_09560 [Holophaga sp.]|jgi:threonine dehydratase